MYYKFSDYSNLVRESEVNRLDKTLEIRQSTPCYYLFHNFADINSKSKIYFGFQFCLELKLCYNLLC